MKYIYLVLLILLLVGCAEKEVDKQDGLDEVTGQYVIELEKTACYSADKADTCDTKLASLGFITKEECCQKYEKCC